MVLLKMSIPVDARYFPRGGVRDAELEAMEVFKFCVSVVRNLFSADKIRWHNLTTITPFNNNAMSSSPITCHGRVKLLETTPNPFIFLYDSSRFFNR